jgi:hypothetical protein
MKPTIDDALNAYRDDKRGKVVDMRDYYDYGNEADTDEVEVLPASFPVAHAGCLHGVAGRFAQAACEKSEADPVGVLAHFLVWAGAYFGNDAALEMGEVIAPPREMAVTVSSSGGGKGTAKSPVNRLMKQFLNPLLMESGRLPIQYRDGPMSSGEGLAHAVRDASETIDEKTGQPLDAGIEDKRLMIVEEEFSAVLDAAKREGNTISSAIRRLWDDGCYSPIIKKNASTTTDAHVCFVGHITYEELIKKLQSTEYTNGFANRILWCCIRRPKIVTIPERIPDNQMQAFASELLQAVLFAQSTKVLTMTPEALKLWDKVARGLATQKSIMSERARPHVLRLATIYALLDCTDRVSAEHVTAALHFWDYCTASAIYIFDGAENEDEEKIVAALRKHGGLTTSEITALVYSNNIKSKALNDLLKSLESKSKITRSTRPNASGKGKPATLFSLSA